MLGLVWGYVCCVGGILRRFISYGLHKRQVGELHASEMSVGYGIHPSFTSTSDILYKVLEIRSKALDDLNSRL